MRCKFPCGSSESQPSVVGFVKELASRELQRISDTGGQRLEKAIQDSRAPCVICRCTIFRRSNESNLAKPPAEGDPRNLGKRICIEHSKQFWIALLICQNNCAASQSGPSCGRRPPSGRVESLLPRVKDDGIGFFLLKQRERLFEGRSNDAVDTPYYSQNAHVVAHSASALITDTLGRVERTSIDIYCKKCIARLVVLDNTGSLYSQWGDTLLSGF